MKTGKTVGVYDRPAKAKWRWVALAIALVLIAVAVAVFGLRRGEAKTLPGGSMVVPAVARLHIRDLTLHY